MNDWLADPFMDELSRRFFDEDSTPAALQTDITENDKRYTMKVNVPGVDKSAISLHYQDQVLTIDVKADQAKPTDGSVLLNERLRNAQSRSFELPDVDDSQIEAELHDGVLTIQLPKLTSASRDNHHIDIE